MDGHDNRNWSNLALPLVAALILSFYFAYLIQLFVEWCGHVG